MATFPTSSTRRTLASALDKAQSQAESLKAIAQNAAAQMRAGPMSAGGIVALLDNLSGAYGVLAQAAGLPGMDTYAQAQLGQSVSDGFTAMMSAIAGAINWAVQNFPKDTDGYLQMATINSDGSRTERSFTSAQTAGLATLLDALVATID